ncbi:endonuclease/exonuclease/phosphatase family protein [Cellulomonas massiliensis]|uniref:endonuclease/exonuclease/phosphatase family protein n=1 Tax=Cellulomonas massiliensis TaxID=1465811 RepID=UPI00031FF808|nr:endonuclease/exonuclease/phosphatase family protein [Cellulomonas massiliensis]
MRAVRAVRPLVWAVAALAAAVGAVLTVPLWAGAFVVAQLVPFRALLGLAALLPAAVMLAVPAARRALWPVAVVLLAVAVGQAGVLLARSVPTAGAGDEGGAADAVTVLSFNTLDVLPAGDLVALVRRTGADVVVLPETSERTAQAVRAALASAGTPMQALTAPGSVPTIAGTALLVSPALAGDYRSEPLPTRLGSLRATSATGPTLAGAHPTAPITRSAMAAWRDETAAVARACAQTPGAVVAGDLNATLDHPGLSDLGPCVDAARAAGRGAVGTWPASAPGVLAAPIDHVLVDARAWRVVGFEVLAPTGGSDHRPVVARLVPR